MSAQGFLTSCTAVELADHLLQNRFDGNHETTMEFVKQCQKIVQQRAQEEEENDDENAVDLGESLLSKSIIMSMISPRGKVSLDFFDGYVRATDVKTSTEAWRLSADQVMQVVVFPKPEDCKKDVSKKTSDVVLLHLTEPLKVKSQKNPVAQVCFVCPTELPEWKTPQVTTQPQDPSVAWNQVWQRAVVGEDTKMVIVKHPDAAAPTAFRSYQADRVSTTSGGMPFVNCYNGTKDGVLFPLMDGSLLFYKPPFFVPSSKVDGISTGGVRGGGSSRYVDLVVELKGKDEGQLEFTNVRSEEVEGLTKFLALAGAEAVVESEGDDSADQSDEEEEDDVATRKRSKRKASVEARRINKRFIRAVPADKDDDDDEEDDIDYAAGNAAHDDDDEEMDDDDDDDDDQVFVDEEDDEDQKDGTDTESEG